MYILAQSIFFLSFHFTAQIFQCCSLKSFSYYPHFTIMFQGKKRWLQLMWFKMASFVLLKQSWLLYTFRALYWAIQFSFVCFFKIPFSFSESINQNVTAVVRQCFRRKLPRCEFFFWPTYLYKAFISWTKDYWTCEHFFRKVILLG